MQGAGSESGCLAVSQSGNPGAELGPLFLPEWGRTGQLMISEASFSAQIPVRAGSLTRTIL